MDKRYTTLSVIGTIHKVLGAIVAAITLLAVLGICATNIIGGAAVDSLGREFGVIQVGLACSVAFSET